MSDNKSPTMLAIIERASLSPDIDVGKMQQLLDMQERIMAKNAEIAFNNAMTRLQPQLPPIKRDAKIKHGDKVISTYAKYEDIDRVIRPLYTTEGFSVSFNSKKDDKGGVTYYGTLSHVEGYSKTAEMELPPDTGGAKNAVQAKGSTMTYAQRYLVGMLFNLVFTDLDDDGAGADEILGEGAAKEIKDMLESTKSDSERFLKFMNAKSIDSIKAKDYGKAITALKAKIRK